MGRPLYTNNAATYLAFGITNTATTMQVSANAGSIFPNPTGGDYFYVSLISLSGPIIEIVKCTARSGDVFTIERGQEGTTPLYWNMGDNVQLRITAAGMNFAVNENDLTAFKAQLLSSTGSSLVGYNEGGTGAVTRTVETKLQESVSVKDFGAVGDGVADDTTAIQNALSSLTSGGTLIIPTGTYKLTSGLTVFANQITVQCQGDTILNWTVLGAATNAVTVSANNFTWIGGIVNGPSSAVYVANERFISMVGTSTSVRKTGLKVYDAEIYNFGSQGIYTQFTDNIIVKNNNIHNCGYAGAMFVSSNHGNFESNIVKNITPGTSSNMYGISLTIDSTNYNTNPNPGTKQATNPFCWDWYIGSNHIENINWEGIDGHGGYEITIQGNHVYATLLGISSAAGSGAAAGYGCQNITIVDNIINAANSDGTASGYENGYYGINVSGGTSLSSSNVIVKNNTIISKGTLGNSNGGAIISSYVYNGIISDNIIQKWGGIAINAIYTADITISNNKILELGGAASGVEYGIGMENVTGTGSTNTVTGNIMYANGGTAGRIGFASTTLTTLPLFKNNSFSAATVAPYTLPAVFNGLLDNMASYNVTVNNAGSGETIDISPMVRYPTFQLNVNSSNASSLVTNLVNGTIRQQVLLYSPNATAWTFNRSNARLAGSANFVASQYDTLVLQEYASVWIENSRSNNG